MLTEFKASIRARLAISRSMDVSKPTSGSSGFDPVSSLVEEAGGGGCAGCCEASLALAGGGAIGWWLLNTRAGGDV